MPFNGSGIYSAPSSPGAFNPAVTAGTADPASWNALLTDLSTGLSTVICRDGQSTITADIPFSTRKITGLGAGVAATDAANVGQISSGAVTGQDDSGAANAYVITPTPAIAAYAAYQRFQFKAANANTTASTLAVSGLAVKSIKRPNGDALVANDILVGAICDVLYDGTNFILLDGGTSAINYSLLTTRGDVITRGASLPQRLALGAAGVAIVSDGTDAVYGSVSLTAGVTGTLPVANGGTGKATGGQIVVTQTSSVATGTTAMPFDDTIPQITEGDQYMTAAITPNSATSKLLITVVWNGSSGAGGTIPFVVALFQDATTDALKAVGVDTATGFMLNIGFSFEMTSGTTSATTFRVRAGDAGGNTTTFNGQSSARLFGGVCASSITITEIP